MQTMWSACDWAKWSLNDRWEPESKWEKSGIRYDLQGLALRAQRMPAKEEFVSADNCHHVITFQCHHLGTTPSIRLPRRHVFSLNHDTVLSGLFSLSWEDRFHVRWVYSFFNYNLKKYCNIVIDYSCKLVMALQNLSLFFFFVIYFGFI